MKSKFPQTLEGWRQNNNSHPHSQRRIEQIKFFKETLARLAAEKYGAEWAKNYLHSLSVIGEHVDNNYIYPVFHFIMPNGDEFVIRQNVINTIISVKMTAVSMNANFNGLFNPVAKYSPEECQGFPSEWIFDCWKLNRKEFTIGLSSSLFDVYVFFWFYFHQVSEKNYKD